MHHERIAIIDYGSQYTRLITRRLRELGAFGLVYSSGATAAEIGGADLKGVILSGGPNSVLEPGAPDLDPAILDLGVPILGICYGQQLLARNLAVACTAPRAVSTARPRSRPCPRVPCCSRVCPTPSRCG